MCTIIGTGGGELEWQLLEQLDTRLNKQVIVTNTWRR
jgi:hypothetical protein